LALIGRSGSVPLSDVTYERDDFRDIWSWKSIVGPLKSYCSYACCCVTADAHRQK